MGKLIDELALGTEGGKRFAEFLEKHPNAPKLKVKLERLNMHLCDVVSEFLDEANCEAEHDITEDGLIHLFIKLLIYLFVPEEEFLECEKKYGDRYSEFVGLLVGVSLFKLSSFVFKRMDNQNWFQAYLEEFPNKEDLNGEEE